MIRGTSHEQDSRFKDKAQKMLLQSKWPDKYDIKIDLSKIDFESLKTWIQKRTTQLLGYQDDIVSGTVLSLLQQSCTKSQKPNAKKIHISMSGFLTTNTLTFISQLWDWLDQAQKSKSGISKKLIDEKKIEQNQKKNKLREINQRKDKIKNYKFDVIRNAIGRQREVSVEKRRRERRGEKGGEGRGEEGDRGEEGEGRGEDDNGEEERNKGHEGEDKGEQRQRDRQDRKKKKKNRGRSQSRDGKKKRKRLHSSEDSEDRQRLAKKSKKTKRKRSYSESNSSQNKPPPKKRSRSRQKPKKRSHKLSSPSGSNQVADKKWSTKIEQSKKHRMNKTQRKYSESRSQSSQVVSSSSQNQN